MVTVDARRVIRAHAIARATASIGLAARTGVRAGGSALAVTLLARLADRTGTLASPEAAIVRAAHHASRAVRFADAQTPMAHVSPGGQVPRGTTHRIRRDRRSGHSRDSAAGSDRRPGCTAAVWGTVRCTDRHNRSGRRTSRWAGECGVHMHMASTH